MERVHYFEERGMGRKEWEERRGERIWYGT